MNNLKDIFNSYIDCFQQNRSVFVKEILDEYSFYISEYRRAGKAIPSWYYKTIFTSEAYDFFYSSVYKLNHIHGIEVDLNTFVSYCSEKKYWKEQKNYYWYCKYTRRLKARTVETKYQRKSHHKKKELTESEVHKREWRKRFERDKRRPYWNDSWKKNMKEESRRLNRRHSKQLINSGLEDMIIPYKRHSDPWDWN